MHESRCHVSRRYGTKVASIPIERNTVKSLTPWAPSITPDSYGHCRELVTGIRRYCGSRHVHGETRLGQIAVVRRWYGGLKNKKAMCIYFSLAITIHPSVTSIITSKLHPSIVRHRDINQPL